MIYQWKQQAIVPLEAQVAGEHLEALRIRNNGHLTPRAVVDAARPKRSPLHPAFEWDDKKAADSYREDQARYILRQITVVVEGNDEPKAVRAFLNVSEDQETHYTSRAVVLSDAELRKQVLHRAWLELRAFSAKYREYEELAGVHSAIDQVEDKLAV